MEKAVFKKVKQRHLLSDHHEQFFFPIILPLNMKSYLQLPKISKFSEGPCLRTLLTWLVPWDLVLIYAAC